MATGLLEMQAAYDEMLSSNEMVLGDIVENVSVEVRGETEVLLERDLLISTDLTDSAIDKVFLGESESMQIKNYISEIDRSDIVRGFVGHPNVVKEVVDPNPPIYSIGSHLYSSRPGCVEEDYFAGLNSANQTLAEVLKGQNYIEDALRHIAARLGLKYQRFGDGKGNEVQFGSLRMWGWGGTVDDGVNKFVALPHEDLWDISNRFPELEVANADNVYAAILCLSTGEDPSRTIIWDKVPTREDDLDPSKKHDYVFTPDMIKGVDSYSIQLHAGDLGIFPAHKIHAVAGSGERCTLSCFFHIHDGKLIFRT